MRGQRFIFKTIGLLCVLSFLFFRQTTLAQDLKDEYDAIEEVPDDEEATSEKGEEDEEDLGEDEGLDEEEDLEGEDLGEDEGLDEEEDLVQEEDLLEDEEEVGEKSPAPSKNAETPAVRSAPSVGVSTSRAVMPPALANVEVTGIEFKQLADRVRVIISANNDFVWRKNNELKRRQLIITLSGARIAKKVLEKVLDTSEFDGPVAFVQPFNSRDANQAAVKVLFQLRINVEPSILKSGHRLYVDFPIASGSGAIHGTSLTTPELPRTFLSVSDQMQFRGAKVTLSLRDAKIQDVLKIISEKSGKNFIYAGESDRRVTLNVRDTPWDQVLSIVLLNAKLGYQKVGETYRVMPVTDLAAEIDQAAAATKKLEQLQPLDTHLVALNYVRADDTKANLEDFKTERGRISVDKRTNTVVITDTADAVARMRQYLSNIDRQTPQVLIEGRMIEARDDLSRDYELSWNGNVGQGALSGSRIGNTITPADAIPAALSFRTGVLGPFSSVAAALNMAEREKKVKTITSPRVTVLDNVEATIAQGTRISLVTVDAQGVPSVSSVDAVISLKVTPQVANDGNVLLRINMRRDTPAGRTGNQIDIDTQNAQTELLVESGKTVVIGGMFTSDTTTDASGIPFLRKLPLLGSLLFDRQNNLMQNKRELMMFISPKILNPEKFFAASSTQRARFSQAKAASAETAPEDDLDDEDIEELEDF